MMRDDGGSTMREGVDKEIPDVVGQNAAMVNMYSTLKDPAPTVVTTQDYIITVLHLRKAVGLAAVLFL
jgi:hypothetical protein